MAVLVVVVVAVVVVGGGIVVAWHGRTLLPHHEVAALCPARRAGCLASPRAEHRGSALGAHEAEGGAAIVAEGRYVYHPERGARRLEAREHPDFEVSGRALLELDTGIYSSTQTASQAKLLMRLLLNHHLNGRALATRQIFTELQQL